MQLYNFEDVNDKRDPVSVQLARTTFQNVNNKDVYSLLSVGILLVL